MPRVKNLKYLGLNISDNLKWDNHVKEIVKKINFIIKSLITILPFASKEVKIQLFFTMILPHYMYASEVWALSLNEHNRKDLRRPIAFYSKLSNIEKNVLLQTLNDQFKKRFMKRIDKILYQTNHPLHKTLMACKQQTKTRNQNSIIYARTSSFIKTFVPSASLAIACMLEPRMV